MITCGSCGGAVAEGSRFCSSCGGLLRADATQTIASHTPRSSERSTNRQPSSATSTSSASVDGSRFVPGNILAGRYRIVALLGRGGMGEVYRADDLTLSQPVALKFLPAELTANEDSVARFRNEVRIARQVSHPNVCRVYDIGEVDGLLFLSMEYVDGEDLGSLLRRIGRLPGDKALEIARGLCAGLAAAHGKGVLHRDLKPGNVMLDGRGHVLLTDFGLAALAHQIEGGEVRSGTPAYMAPEQLSGKEVTIRSDLYSLGLLLYELFTGKRPFESGTLAELVRARTETAPTNPSSLVRDLDPAVERAILRCLEAEPSRRPSSALAVSAALPGGDPLAAALAAGETPSPEMVAAAGEGEGLTPKIAIGVLLATLAGIVASFVLATRASALEQIRPPYSPEVLRQKARDIIQRLGYDAPAVDDASGLGWDQRFVDYVSGHDKPFPRWTNILLQQPPLLRFWYRQSNYPLIGVQFHDDLLTPGVVMRDDPPPILSGMIEVEIDSQGRLCSFAAMPKQFEERTQPALPVDWNATFSAAGLDLTKFEPAEPLWTWLATSDTRVAWTGTWPDSGRPLRVEAAAWRGKPVGFSLIGPWTKPLRMPPVESAAGEQTFLVLVITIALVLIIGAPLLARRNIKLGKGDRRGAARLAAFIFFTGVSVWLCRGHFVGSLSIAGPFFVAICTAVFYAAVVWTVYVALEPYVRRYWPHALISWTRVLTGQLRDPGVARDVLLGTAFGVGLAVAGGLLNRVTAGPGTPPGLDDVQVLMGIRAGLGEWLANVLHSVRETLLFFFLLFLLRVFLRNRWLAAASFTVILVFIQTARSAQPWTDGAVNTLIFGTIAVIGVRLGLLPLAVGIFVTNVLGAAPLSTHPSAWYFGSTALLLAFVAGLAAWACYVSLAGRRLWREDLFG